jgi:structural maintenance of chromosome 3 (chondroitin sulfate proteoglycan 6)
LIDSLDRRKNEAIEHTFHDVAGNFSKIFEVLVPAGRGELVMKSEVTANGDSMEVDNQSNSVVDRFSGISIKVICLCLKIK